MSISSSPVIRGRMDGKVCVITGAGSPRGIGWTTIKRFADEGARHIYALDINSTGFDSLRSDFEKAYLNTKITFVQADVAEEAPIKAICERAVEENGRLDVFFANAAIFGSGYGETYFDADLDLVLKVLKVNVGSVFVALKHAPSAMSKTHEATGKLHGGGSIILTGSTAGMRGGLGPMEYSASKAAVMNMAMTASLANTQAHTNVRINALAPGPVKTDFLPSQLNPYTGNTDFFCDALEIANAALFLASDESSFVNGQSLVIDNALTNNVLLTKMIV